MAGVTGNGAGRGGPARGYKWKSATRDNAIALQHGAYSPRVVDPLAAAIVADQLAAPSCPPHLTDDPERWKHALHAWGRAEATVLLIRQWLEGQDVADLLSEHTEALEETTERKGGSTKRTTGKRRESALAALDRAERTAAARRTDLGLTPLSAARLKIDLAPKFDLAAEIMRLSAEEAADGR